MTTQSNSYAMIDDWWAEPVKQIYRDSLSELDGDYTPLNDGPGHIVWADGNFSDEDVRHCLKSCKDRRSKYVDKFGENHFAVVYKALERLLAIPEEVRDCDPYCE